MSSQVKKKAAEADEMIRQLAAGQVPESAVSDEPTGEEEPQPEAADVVALQPADEQPAAEPSEINEGPAAPSSDEIAELREAARKADARWRSLQGQIDSKDRQIEQLHALLANMQEAAPAEEAPKQEQPKGWTQQDEDAFGSDMIELMDRISESKLKGYTDRIAELESRLTNVTEQTASTVQDTFESRLTKLSANWETINQDPEFIEWLQESSTRQQLFQAAAQKKDAKGVAEFFNLYGQLKGLNTPKPSAKEKLEKQVAPGKARNPAPQPAVSTPDEEKIWTRSEIGAFYKTGKKNYSAEEFAKIERDIARAMKDERVDYTK